MDESIYQIQAIKSVKSTFDVDKMRMGDKYICEVSIDGTIKQYRMEPGNRKHLDILIKKVDTDEVKQFFTELRKLLIAADREFMTVDDTSRELIVVYSPSHKEIFSEQVAAGSISAEDLLDRFILSKDSNVRHH